MSITRNNPRYVFWFVGDVTHELTAKFKRYLYQCKADGTDAIAMISGDGGKICCVRDIAETLKATKVHLTTVGFANVYSVTAAIFFLGDERVLMHGTNLILEEVEPTDKAFYSYNLSFSDEIWKEKVLSNRSKSWEVKESEWRKYGFTTMAYSKVVKRIVTIYGNDFSIDFQNCFFFCNDFELMQTVDFIEYIYECASIGKDVFVEISSTGGRANCLEAVLDTLRCTKLKLITIGGGEVASCSALLFLQGDVRTLKAGTEFLLHSSRIFPQKDSIFVAEDMAYEGKELIKLDKRFEELTFNKTAIPKEKYRSYIKGGIDWTVKEEYWKEYVIVTNTYEEVVEMIVKG